MKVISTCSKLLFFDRHTGESRYPEDRFSLENWIPVFTGMTFQTDTFRTYTHRLVLVLVNRNRGLMFKLEGFSYD